MTSVTQTECNLKMMKGDTCVNQRKFGRWQWRLTKKEDGCDNIYKRWGRTRRILGGLILLLILLLQTENLVTQTS
jgi:hypothetical protein